MSCALIGTDQCVRCAGCTTYAHYVCKVCGNQVNTPLDERVVPVCPKEKAHGAMERVG